VGSTYGRFCIKFPLIYSKPCLLQLPRPYSFQKYHDLTFKASSVYKIDFGILLCIVGGTESVYGFPTDKNDRCVFTRDSELTIIIGENALRNLNKGR
jgi:hypothetical protein